MLYLSLCNRITFLYVLHFFLLLFCWCFVVVDFLGSGLDFVFGYDILFTKHVDQIELRGYFWSAFSNLTPSFSLSPVDQIEPGRIDFKSLEVFRLILECNI